MKYSLVIWDFDGTLADTLRIALRIYNQLAEQHGFQPIRDAHAVRDMGMREFLNSHGIPAWRVPFAFRRFLRELRSQADRISLHDGIIGAVRRLQKAGIQQVVISSNATETIAECLSRHNVSASFERVIGTSLLQGKHRRITSTARELGVSAANVLYVGDEIRDCEAAMAAGVDMAAVTWGLNSAAALQKSDPVLLAENPAELVDLILYESNAAAQ